MPMRLQPESDTTTIVMIGPFTPIMFHPLWFEARGLIGKQEAADAELAVLHEDLTSFTTTRVTVEVQRQRFTLAATLVPDDIRDMAIELLTLHLPGVPIRAVGINRGVHFNAGSQELQHKIGVTLAPRDPWGAWGKQMADGETMANRSGMVSLKMQRTRRDDEPPGYVQVRVEPSGVILRTGIFMEVNNHYQTLSDPPEAADASGALEAISAHWGAANACAEQIIDQIMSLAQPDRAS